MALNDDDFGFYYHSLNDWVAGSGELDDAVEYTQDGGTQNWRSLQPNHLGRQEMVWEATRKPHLTGEDDNVGWGASITIIDNDATFDSLCRRSIWLKKTVSNSGEMILKGYGTGSYRDGRRTRTYSSQFVYLDGTNTTIPDAAYLQIGTLSDEVFPPNQWFLCVNHVYPSGTDFGDINYKHPDSGIYYPDGTKLSLTGITHWDTTHSEPPPSDSALWRTVTNTTYLHGSGTPSVQMYQPRFDVVDGREPKIDWLLKDRGPTTVSTNLGTLMM